MRLADLRKHYGRDQTTGWWYTITRARASRGFIRIAATSALMTYSHSRQKAVGFSRERKCQAGLVPRQSPGRMWQER